MYLLYPQKSKKYTADIYGKQHVTNHKAKML